MRQPDASFELLARRILGKCRLFQCRKNSMSISSSGQCGWPARHGVIGVVRSRSTAETLISAAERQWPVNALDLALAQGSRQYQGYIEGLELTDYRVRISIPHAA